MYETYTTAKPLTAYSKVYTVAYTESTFTPVHNQLISQAPSPSQLTCQRTEAAPSLPLRRPAEGGQDSPTVLRRQRRLRYLNLNQEGRKVFRAGTALPSS